MGTRSATGVRIDGADKLAYNQFDGYLSGVGQNILEELRADIANLGFREAIESWIKMARDAKLIQEGGPPPTAEEIEALKHYADTGVSTGELSDWYVLLRDLHGAIIARLKAGYILENNAFINDSLFCEWGYVVNLDELTLEIYRGFQQERHDKGRYASNEPEGGYYPCALIATIPLGALPGIENLEKFLMETGAIPKEEESA